MESELKPANLTWLNFLPNCCFFCAFRPDSWSCISADLQSWLQRLGWLLQTADGLLKPGRTADTSPRLSGEKHLHQRYFTVHIYQDEAAGTFFLLSDLIETTKCKKTFDFKKMFFNMFTYLYSVYVRISTKLRPSPVFFHVKLHWDQLWCV